MLKKELEEIGITYVIDWCQRIRNEELKCTHYRFKKFEIDIVTQKNEKLYYHEVRVVTKHRLFYEIYNLKKLSTLYSFAYQMKYPSIMLHAVYLDSKVKVSKHRHHSLYITSNI